MLKEKLYPSLVNINSTENALKIENLLMKKVRKFQIESITIPRTWYNIIKDKNDYLRYNVDGGGDIVFIIPEGYYTADELLEVIVDEVKPHNPTFCGEVLPLTGKVCFADVVKPTVFYFEDDNTPSKELGFKNEQTVTPTTGDYVVNMNITNNIYICSSVLASSIKYAYLKNFDKLSRKNIIKVLPVTVQSGEMILYKNSGEDSGFEFNDLQNVNNVDLQIFFDDGYPVPLNGSVWSICIKLFKLDN